MNQDKLNILIIEGTNRPGRQSIKVARLLEKIGKTIEGIEVKLADAAEFNLPLDGDGDEQQDPNYKALLKWADGFMIVVPEYNHGYSGSLKRMLDSEYGSYTHKAATAVGVSSGPWGGVRATQNIQPVLRELGLVTTFTNLYFPKIKEFFDENGNPKDQDYEKHINEAYEELIWMTKALKVARLTNPSKYERS